MIGNFIILLTTESTRPIDRYCDSLYWTVATMTSTGYGDLHPTNTSEMSKYPFNNLIFSFLPEAHNQSLELQYWGWFSGCPGCQLSNQPLLWFCVPSGVPFCKSFVPLGVPFYESFERVFLYKHSDRFECNQISLSSKTWEIITHRCQAVRLLS